MRNIRILIFSSLFLLFSSISYGQDIVFVNLQKILNESKAGKQAQDFLKKKINNEKFIATITERANPNNTSIEVVKR